MNIVICGPSGVGKSTLLKKFLSKHVNFRFAISVTTRQKRIGETHGIDYYFCSTSEFLSMKEQGLFLEVETIFNHYYGTLKTEIEEENTILDLNPYGLKKILQKKKLLTIGIIPPSIFDLKLRLEKRGEQQINERMANLKNELSILQEYCSYLIVNRCPEEALYDFENIVIGPNLIFN